MKERRGPSPFLSALFSFPLPPRLLSFSTIFYLLRVPRSRRFCSSPLFFSSFFRPRTPGIQRCWTVATQQAIVQLFLAGTPKVRYISGAAIRGPLRDVTRWRLVRPNLPLFPPGFLNTVFPKAAHPPSLFLSPFSFSSPVSLLRPSPQFRARLHHPTGLPRNLPIRGRGTAGAPSRNHAGSTNSRFSVFHLGLGRPKETADGSLFRSVPPPDNYVRSVTFRVLFLPP